ncbi:chromosomal replication initiator protein DnaA [bacterium]|nr:chromosomal replication initiator protein DnaA [bacterium]
MEALWSTALPALRQHMGERNFAAWIEPITCRMVDGELRLEVPSRFFQSWVTRHFLPTIHDTLSSLAGAPCTVRVVVAAEGNGVPRPAPDAPAPEPTVPARPARVANIGRLIPSYTFESFVVGPSNDVAFRTAQAVSEAPGVRYNPMFLHGGVGLGKTHLINAIGHEILRRRARARVAVLSSESFMNTLIAALRKDQMNAFREKFRQVDALILDDVQFLAGKERTQEEFFHTFNALHEAQKQIVLTSDKAPADIRGLEQRLRSRFEGGLMAEIHPPTREMRAAILRAKSRAQQVELSDQVLELFVQRGGNSVRELEGALNRALALALVRGTGVTTEVALAALGPYARVRSVSVETVQEMVSDRFGVTIADLVSHRREREVSYPRQIAMYLSRTVAEASFPTIAEKFGGRDHTTVMYAVKTIETRRARDLGVDQLLSGFEGALRDR